MTSVDMLVSNADKVPFLSREEQYGLARRYKKGDIAAGQRLISSNIRFALKLAHSYARKGYPLEDLVQEACEGMCAALKKFDPDKGFLFITYAFWHIRVQMQRFCANNSAIARYNSNRVVLIDAAATRVRMEHPEASDEEVAWLVCDEKGYEFETVMPVIMRRRSLVHIDAPQDGELADSAPSPEDIAIESNKASAVRERLNVLSFSARDRDIIERRLMRHDSDAETLKQLGDRHGVSRERLRQCEVHVKKRLRDQLVEVL